MVMTPRATKCHSENRLADRFDLFGKPRDLPEVKPLQGEWDIEASSDARMLLGLRDGTNRVRFDGTHVYAVPDKEAGVVLYALAGSPEEGELSASAWLIAADAENGGVMPYCVRLSQDGDDWSLMLSYDPTPLLAVKSGDEQPLRALPIRAAEGDENCHMQAAAPIIKLRRPE